MFRTAPRGTHRSPGPAVIDYRGLAAPVGKSVGGVAVIGAVATTAALQSAPAADALTAPVQTVRGGSTAAPAAPTSISQYSGVKLRLGARGDAVKTLQSELNAKGASLAVDGVFGSRTLSAVRSFQSSAGIGVDGVVGPKTWGKLGGSASTDTSSSSQPKLRSGSRGSAVKTLQSRLNDAGASLSVDGVFGSRTLSAVRSLQSSAGIGVDGVVGPKTWGAINSGQKITGSAPAANVSTGSSSSFDGQAIVSTARAQLGVGYAWGEETPSAGFDCSGLVHWAYNQSGHSMPRKTAKGYTFGGTIIPRSQAQPGDLVAFTGNDYGHMGIYVGNGKIIDASGSRQRVVERSIWNSPHVFVTYR